MNSGPLPSSSGLLSSNRVYVARTKRQAARWNYLLPSDIGSTAARVDFSRTALVGVFFVRSPVSQVKVTSVFALDPSTLELTIEVVPPEQEVCVPPPGGGCPIGSR
jgi:hypothetical protein